MAGLDIDDPELAERLRQAGEPTLRQVARAAAELALELQPVDDGSVSIGLDLLRRGEHGDSALRETLERLVEELDVAQWELEEQLDAYGEGPVKEVQAVAYDRARATQTVLSALDEDPVVAALDSLYEMTGLTGHEPDVLRAFAEAVMSGRQGAVERAAATLRERGEKPEPGEGREQFVGPDGVVPGLDFSAPDVVDSLRGADAETLRQLARAVCELALERAPIDDARIEAARQQLELDHFGDSTARAELRELVDELLAEEAELEGEWDRRPLEDRERNPSIPSYRVEKGILVPDGTEEEVALEHARLAAERPALRRTATAYALWQALDEDPLNAAIQAVEQVHGAFMNLDELRSLVAAEVSPRTDC